MALEYLQSIYEQPIICVSAFNPWLFKEVPQLQRCRENRLRLVLQYEILQQCPERKAFLREENALDLEHLFANTEVYSLKDLVDLKTEDSRLNQRLETVSKNLNVHIISCSHCERRAKVRLRASWVSVL